MARVRGKNTRPEKLVRSALFGAGFRFRLHVRKLPGNPDLIFPRYRTAVFVHGCFWHGHDCPRGRRPQTNRDFWNEKLDRNIARDRANQAALRKMGWKVFVVWACQLDTGTGRVRRYLTRRRQEQVGMIADQAPVASIDRAR